MHTCLHSSEQIMNLQVSPEQSSETLQTVKMENWQKAHENGEYLRRAEMSEEANYNMIESLLNNKSSKK